MKGQNGGHREIGVRRRVGVHEEGGLNGARGGCKKRGMIGWEGAGKGQTGLRYRRAQRLWLRALRVSGN